MGDEDYMIKTKDVIGLFVSVKEEPKVEEPAPVEEVEAEPEEDADAKKKKKKKKKAAKKIISSFLYFCAKTLVAPQKASNFEDSTFQKRNGRYDGIRDQPRSNNIVSWYLTSTDISFIKIRNLPIKIFYCGDKKKKKKKKKKKSTLVDTTA